jgi:hypothetical protein
MLGAADINQALSKGGGTIFKFAFLLGCVFIIGGGIQIRNGDGGAALYSIVGGLVVACAAPIMRELFQNAGMGNSAIDIGWQVRPTVNYYTVLAKTWLQGASI